MGKNNVKQKYGQRMDVQMYMYMYKGQTSFKSQDASLARTLFLISLKFVPSIIHIN